MDRTKLTQKLSKSASYLPTVIRLKGQSSHINRVLAVFIKLLAWEKVGQALSSPAAEGG